MDERIEIFGSFAQHICISDANEAILSSGDGHIQHPVVLQDAQAFSIHLLHPQWRPNSCQSSTKQDARKQRIASLGKQNYQLATSSFFIFIMRSYWVCEKTTLWSKGAKQTDLLQPVNLSQPAPFQRTPTALLQRHGVSGGLCHGGDRVLVLRGAADEAHDDVLALRALQVAHTNWLETPRVVA